MALQDPTVLMPLLRKLLLPLAGVCRANDSGRGGRLLRRPLLARVNNDATGSVPDRSGQEAVVSISPGAFAD